MSYSRSAHCRSYLCSLLEAKDGRVLCHSTPTYGVEKEAGNETGYIVGMSTCYPSSGTREIADGEALTLESNYSSTQMHAAVMGIFYMLVADAEPKIMLHHSLPVSCKLDAGRMKLSNILALVLVCGLAALMVSIGSHQQFHSEGYQSLVSTQT